MTNKKPPEDTLTRRIRAVTGAARPAATPKAPERGSVKGERRQSQRQDKYKPAYLILEAGEQFLVAVRNISETGARVDFHGASGVISDHVCLSLPSLGLKRQARIVWKDQNSAGLVFEPD